MADDTTGEVNWQSEAIPDTDTLYMRIHENHIENGQIILGAFRNHGAGMSTDWSKYSTPADTRRRARDPVKNGVIAMKVGDVRQIPGQSVQHTPKADNRAHTDVFGDKSKDPEVRLRFRKISRWAIGKDSPPE